MARVLTSRCQSKLRDTFKTRLRPTLLTFIYQNKQSCRTHMGPAARRGRVYYRAVLRFLRSWRTLAPASQAVRGSLEGRGCGGGDSRHHRETHVAGAGGIAGLRDDLDHGEDGVTGHFVHPCAKVRASSILKYTGTRFFSLAGTFFLLVWPLFCACGELLPVFFFLSGTLLAQPFYSSWCATCLLVVFLLFQKPVRCLLCFVFCALPTGTLFFNEVFCAHYLVTLSLATR